MDIEEEEVRRSLLGKHDSSEYHRQGELNASKWRIGAINSRSYLRIIAFASNGRVRSTYSVA